MNFQKIIKAIHNDLRARVNSVGIYNEYHMHFNI